MPHHTIQANKPRYRLHWQAPTGLEDKGEEFISLEDAQIWQASLDSDPLLKDFDHWWEDENGVIVRTLADRKNEHLPPPSLKDQIVAAIKTSEDRIPFIDWITDHVRKTTWSDKSTTFLIDLFGLKIAFGWAGNCITPAIHFESRPKSYMPPDERERKDCNPSIFTITLRGVWFHRQFEETIIHVHSSGHLSWNSDAVARIFGTFVDNSEHSGTSYYFYEGVLGIHMYL